MPVTDGASELNKRLDMAQIEVLRLCREQNDAPSDIATARNEMYAAYNAWCAAYMSRSQSADSQGVVKVDLRSLKALVSLFDTYMEKHRKYKVAQARPPQVDLSFKLAHAKFKRLKSESTYPYDRI